MLTVGREHGPRPTHCVLVAPRMRQLGRSAGLGIGTARVKTKTYATLPGDCLCVAPGNAHSGSDARVTLSDLGNEHKGSMHPTWEPQRASAAKQSLAALRSPHT